MTARKCKACNKLFNVTGTLIDIPIVIATKGNTTVCSMLDGYTCNLIIIPSITCMLNVLFFDGASVEDYML